MRSSRLFRSEHGTSTIEYAIIIGGIVLAVGLSLRSISTIRQALGTTATAVQNNSEGTMVTVEDTTEQ